MKKSILIHKIWQDPAYFIAFGFGSGLITPASGTWGTLCAIPIYLLLTKLAPIWYLFFLCAAFAVGVWASDKVSKELGIHDHQGIVCDEIVGYLLTLFMVPFGVIWIVLGFLLFRLFDIWKPYPICIVDERIKGGLGIMLDDVLAAIPAWLIIQLCIWIWDFTR